MGLSIPESATPRAGAELAVRLPAVNRRLKIRPGAVLAGLLLAGLVVVAVGGEHLAPRDPLAIDLDCVMLRPGPGHWFGTDTLGRDVFSRVVAGTRYSLLIGLGATLVSLAIGLVTGLTAGYAGGKADACFTVLTDIVLAFPSLLLAIGIAVLMPPGLSSCVVALAAVGWASFARLFRGMALSLRECVFIDAARAAGCSHGRILRVHVLPHCSSIALVAGSLKVGTFILAESALSFLGLGIQPPLPTWGAMVSLHRAYLPSAPWMLFFPGAAIALTVFLCNFLGDMLRDALDPNVRV